MATTLQNRDNDFHWTAPEFFVSFLVGAVAVAGLWLFTGLLIMLFLM